MKKHFCAERLCDLRSQLATLSSQFISLQTSITTSFPRIIYGKSFATCNSEFAIYFPATKYYYFFSKNKLWVIVRNFSPATKDYHFFSKNNLWDKNYFIKISTLLFASFCKSDFASGKTGFVFPKPTAVNRLGSIPDSTKKSRIF